MASVKTFLEETDQSIVKVLVDNAIPSDVFCGAKLKPITQWMFCDVTGLSGAGSDEIVKLILGKYMFVDDVKTEVTLKQLDSGDAVEFVSFLKHIQNEFKKISTLMEHLNKAPDDDMQISGIEKLNAFGVMAIYYSIDKDPLKWDAISELPFMMVYTRLSIDKVHSEIQAKYTKQMIERQKNKRL